MSNELTTTRTFDGFDNIPTESGRGIIRGTKLKFDGGDWIASDDTVLPERLVVGNIAIFDQRWKGGLPAETMSYEDGRPLEGLDALNEAIPHEQWEENPFGGGVKPPWQRQYVVYLLDPSTGTSYTSINSTIGQARAFEILVDRVRCMRKLRGPNVTPVVALGSATMKTRYGLKERPEFEIVGWQNLGGDALEPAQLTKPSTEELVSDSIPFNAGGGSLKGHVGSSATPTEDDEDKYYSPYGLYMDAQDELGGYTAAQRLADNDYPGWRD